MEFIDTHTHIYLDQFKDDFDEMINRALENDVRRFFLPNIDENTMEAVNKLRDLNPNRFYPMMGLHPCSVRENYKEQLDQILGDFEKRSYTAVGEIGIDLYWDRSLQKQQEIAFREQIKFAKKNHLPIVIHARDSFDEIFKIVDEENDEHLRGIFHCFTGTSEQAQHILNYGGFLLGLGGVLTFKNSGLDKVVQNIDLKHIVLETDAPYLAPHPYRGKRNEPAYVRIIAEKLAEVHNRPLEEVAEITTQNALQMFEF